MELIRRSFLPALFAIVFAAVLFPSVAFAAAPPSKAYPIVNEGFEGPTYDRHMTVNPIATPFPASAWWGPITQRHVGGQRGFWCAGSVPASWPVYPQLTQGSLLFSLPELADYYSSSTTFKYTMPTLGPEDYDSFGFSWQALSGPGAGLWDYHHFGVTADNVWSGQSFSMAHDTTYVNLSRTPGEMNFLFIDKAEGAGQTIFTGQGVTIDDVVIAGYKYGPVRSLTATRSGEDIVLSWGKPYAQVGSTTVDTRSLTYRVWRAPIASPNTWTELTSSRLTGTTYSDTTADPAEYYQYFVQAWDPIGDAGYGEGNPAVDIVRVPAVGGKLVEFLPVQGIDRYATAIAAVGQAFPSGSNTVVIAYGGNFPDALGAAALCGAWDAPLLLSQRDVVSTDVVDAITNLGATHAIIIGNVLTANAENRIAGLVGGAGHVDRLGGLDRYDTAAMVSTATTAKLGASSADDVFLAVGDNFPDALAASPAAFAKRWPILLTPRKGLSKYTISAIGALKPKRIHILGSIGAVPQLVEDQVKALYPSATIDRWMGDNRYGTAVDIANKSGLPFTGLAIATGANFPDALAGGVMAGKLGGPVLLTPTTSLADETRGAILAHKAEIGVVRYLGSTTAVGTAVRTSVVQLLQ